MSDLGVQVYEAQTLDRSRQVSRGKFDFLQITSKLLGNLTSVDWSELDTNKAKKAELNVN